MECNEPKPCLHGIGECPGTRMAKPYWYKECNEPKPYFMVLMNARDLIIRRGWILCAAVKKEGNDQHGGKEKHFNLCRAKAI
jgi:hypothetical protein